MMLKYAGLKKRLGIRKEKVAVVGLGYVGLPLALAFSKWADVIGYDTNSRKIEQLRAGIDMTREVGEDALKAANLLFTSEESRLKEAKFFIIAVPTPVLDDKTPDLSPVISASEAVGRNLSKGSVVVYESTVYPGVTEEICLPILELKSGLQGGVDFKVGYSPERINPGDKEHRLDTIVKVVSGMDAESLELIAKVYEMVIKVGVYKAESIKVAEAAKIMENAQRDVNIAFMNELSGIFDRMGIDMRAVMRAASTKWNFLRFEPGLVGGHCIGVDPYYIIYKAGLLGYRSEVMAAGRKVNDGVGIHIAQNAIKCLIQADKKVKGSRVAILGFTYKKNCKDARNTKVVDIIDELERYGVCVYTVDPVADEEETFCEYGIKPSKKPDFVGLDALILAVPHDEFKTITLQDIQRMCSSQSPVIIDVTGAYDRHEAETLGFIYWRL